MNSLDPITKEANVSTPPASATSQVHTEGRAEDRPSEKPASASPRDRWPHALTQGGAGLGLTAAGLIAGVVLESETKLSHKLPIHHRRPTRAGAIRDAIAKRLP